VLFLTSRLRKSAKKLASTAAPRDDKMLIEPVTLEPELGTALLV
jgi:hypothetical protein